MVPTSKWFEALSADEDTTRVRAHLDKLIEEMIATAALRQGGRDDIGARIRTVLDPKYPHDRANSL